jgi:hypothetical protein
MTEKQKEKTRRQTGMRFDIELINKLKIEALTENINTEDLINRELWSYIEKKEKQTANKLSRKLKKTKVG